jgi:hypothetical protein
VEDHIRELCNKLTRTENAEEAETLGAELRLAIKNYVNRLRAEFAAYPITSEHLGIEKE